MEFNFFKVSNRVLRYRLDHTFFFDVSLDVSQIQVWSKRVKNKIPVATFLDKYVPAAGGAVKRLSEFLPKNLKREWNHYVFEADKLNDIKVFMQKLAANQDVSADERAIFAKLAEDVSEALYGSKANELSPR